jgi:hypothetical protein
VLRVHKEQQALWVKVETKELKERQVLQALKEQQALWVKVETKVLKER